VVKKLAIVKTGWSEDYRGGAVSGDFGFIADNEEGHERFNFAPGPDGNYYGYLPPIGKSYAVPCPPDPEGWLVVFVAKRANKPGLFIVGWYEDATFHQSRRSRKEYAAGIPFPHDSFGEEFIYAIEAPRATLVPEALRTERLNTNRIKSTPIAYLRGAGGSDEWRSDLARDVLDQLERLKREIPAAGLTRRGGAGGFYAVDPEYRAEVEEQAMQAAEAYLEQEGYKVDRVHLENRGYDLLARRSRAPHELHVEVKGTGGTTRQFILTRKEQRYVAEPKWRLALVLDALGTRKVELMARAQFLRDFSVEPLSWQAKEKKS
jgi:hypothetical protein